MNKKGSIWTWILIILLLIIIIVGIYLWVSGKPVSSIMPWGNSIPKPPALPN